jgi:hypothetical protein
LGFFAALRLGVEIKERETVDVLRRLVAPKCNEGESAVPQRAQRGTEAVGIFSRRRTPDDEKQ